MFNLCLKFDALTRELMKLWEFYDLFSWLLFSWEGISTRWDFFLMSTYALHQKSVGSNISRTNDLVLKDCQKCLGIVEYCSNQVNRHDRQTLKFSSLFLLLIPLLPRWPKVMNDYRGVLSAYQWLWLKILLCLRRFMPPLDWRTTMFCNQSCSLCFQIGLFSQMREETSWGFLPDGSFHGRTVISLKGVIFGIPLFVRMQGMATPTWSWPLASGWGHFFLPAL